MVEAMDSPKASQAAPSVRDTPDTDPADTRNVRDFTEIDRHATELVGGKGANLGELTAAGLRVPPGFVVTATGYLAAMDAGGVREELRRLGQDLDVRDTAALSAGAKKLQGLVGKAGMPEALKAQVLEACLSGWLVREPGAAVSQPRGRYPGMTRHDTAV